MQKTPQLVAGVHRKGQPPRRICSPKCIFGATINQSALEGIYKRFETSCDRRIALLNPSSPVNQPRTFGSDKCKPFVEFMHAYFVWNITTLTCDLLPENWSI